MEEIKFKIDDRVMILPEYAEKSGMECSILFVGKTGYVTEEDENPFIILDEPVFDFEGRVWHKRAVGQDELILVD